MTQSHESFTISFPSKKSGSVNAALVNNSVEYIPFNRRVLHLSQIDWYIKADLKMATDSFLYTLRIGILKIYTLGKNECYIDIAMPFGKANSSNVFCTWTSAWCESFSRNFRRSCSIPIFLGSYVDYFFGGPIRTESLVEDKKNATSLLKNLIEIGEITNTRMNLEKCTGPAKRMNILGIVFDSIARACFVAPKKVTKYCCCLQALLNKRASSSRD